MKAASFQSFRDAERTPGLGFWKRVQLRLRWLKLNLSVVPKVGDLLGVPKPVQDAFKESAQLGAAGAATGGALVDVMASSYTPDRQVEALAKPVLNPMIAFHEALLADGDAAKCTQGNPFAGQKVRVEEAWLFEAQTDENGRILTDPKIREAIRSPWPKPDRVRHVRGHAAYVEAFQKAQATHAAQPARAQAGREAIAGKLAFWRSLQEDGFLAGTDTPNNLFSSSFDPNQYTEYAPLMGGPYYRQLYIYDFLQQVAYAFEAWNHNPLAKAIIRIITQYALGRRFTVQVKDGQKKKLWEDYAERTDYIRMVCEFWSKETEIYGEFDYDWQNGVALDPSTIWDIITDPDRVDIEYYAYQSYPTAYQMFTGYSVPGEPKAADQPGSAYIVRQIPSWKLLRLKKNCVSNEKRGRSSLFPILGWLKRVKDLYNAEVIREWLYSCFMWDVTLKNANQSDVNAYVAANTAIPLPGSKNIHNDKVEIQAMPAIATGGRGGGGGVVAENVLCFIAVAMNIPKEFLNITTPAGGGSRAMALTSAEPFTKMVEDVQAGWEWFTTQVFKRVIESAGLKFEKDDLEVTFPSVTKDTTTEALKNLTVAEEMAWLSHKRCMEMAAKELNVTNFDPDQETADIESERQQGIGPTGGLPPGGRFGFPGQPPDAGQPGGVDGGSEIHGKGKVGLSTNLKTL